MKTGVVNEMSRGGGAVPNTHSRASAELGLKMPWPFSLGFLKRELSVLV